MISFDIQLFRPIQSVLSMNINSPIRKLLVSINQCLILPSFTICKLIYNIYVHKKVAIVIDIDDVGNLEDLLKKSFINEKCKNLKVVVDGRELFRNIEKQPLEVFYEKRSS